MAENLMLSLAMTLLLELGYAWIWGVKDRDYLTILWMNLLTNPLVVLWYHVHRHLGFLIHTIFPELLAVIVEILILKRYARNIRKPALLVICMNVFSYFCGLLYVIFFI